MSRVAPHEASPNEALTLSVVVPVFNQGSLIIENVRVIRQRIAERLGEPFEIILVSDGSIDETEEKLLEVEHPEVRVFHYARNLGKGYAVKLGALEARADWVGFCDSDLDLDPGDLANYVRTARDHDLAFAIGSKRHPDSEVSYPRSRVAASWLLQQLIRLLFRLDVRDTQVGLKVFSRDVADQVVPLLLVKRYAFDVELLAVARSFGFDRVEELPVHLDYKFTGSGVRSLAALRALMDIVAIFYRLRVLHYYQRKRRLAGPFGWTRPRDFRPLVSVFLSPGAHFRESDYPNVEILEVSALGPTELRQAAEKARGEALAILEPGASASANWLAATVPFLRRDEVVGVVVPKMAPLDGSVRARAAAAVDESRIGAGLGYFRNTPGNVRYVEEFPATSIVVRRKSLMALPGPIPIERLVAALAADHGRVLYTPESVVVVRPMPLFAPHLRAVMRRGQIRAGLVRRGAVTLRIAPFVVPALLILAAGLVAVRIGGVWTDFFASVGLIYLVAVGTASMAAVFRHKSLAVGGLTAVGIMLTHCAYLVGFTRRFVAR